MRRLDLASTPDFGLSWLDATGPDSDIVLSTRVRIARNLQGYPFSIRAKPADRAAILATVREAVDRMPPLADGVILELDTLEARGRQLLLERHLVSRELAGAGGADSPSSAALVSSLAEPVGLMINEEDHLRLQSLTSGFGPRKTWRLVDSLDEDLGSALPFAFHHEFGHLTSCPTNCGTGLRASVLIHLPGLVLTKEINKVLQGITQVGLTFRGLYGEGSEVIGNLFQVSNQTTLGKSEEDLIDHLHKIVGQVVEYERQARSVLLRDAPNVIEDKVWRAYGLLRHARSLGFDEMMNLLSGVRLGLSLKLLLGPSVFVLNRIMIFAQNAHLEEASAGTLAVGERDFQRASHVRAALAEAERAADR
ncbi:MAG: protein arginine kinase [Gemmatimonadota bacterium]|nr:MAG: protein arginine kinase [Gemmatimonadota bacterium]